MSSASQWMNIVADVEVRAPVRVALQAVTLRAVFIGIIGAIILGIVTPISDLFIQGTWIACAHLPIGAFILFLALVCVFNPVLRLLHHRWALSSAELATAYTIMLVGAGIPSFGLTAYLFPTIAGVTYYATPENRWRELFFDYIPRWMIPWDREVVRYYFEGRPAGVTIPWQAWALPIAMWTLLAFALFLLMACITTILRRQWADHEKLTFPLVRLPLAILNEGEERSSTPFLRNRLMWLGFALPFIVHGINGIHVYYPSAPYIPLVHPLHSLFTSFPWTRMGTFIIWIHFSVIGITYLLSTDLALSLWLFYLISKLQTVFYAWLGYPVEYMPGYPVPAFLAMQMLGAFVVIAIMMVWNARRHLCNVLRIACGLDSTDEDANEPMSYKAAVWGGLIAFGIAIIWCVHAGMSLTVAIATWVLFFLFIAIVLTRFISEGGMLFIQAPFRPTDMIITLFGSAPLGVRNLTAMAFVQRVFIFDVRAFPMPSFLDAYKLASVIRIAQRPLLKALLVGIMAATLSSYWSHLKIAYWKGGVTLLGWFMQVSPKQPFTFLSNYLQNPMLPQWHILPYAIAGAGFTMFLFLMRARIPWWFLHPIGYAMGPSWPMIQLWFSTLVGWILKSLIVRYGGFQAFRFLRPLFLGMVLGEYTAAGVWLGIDAAYHKQGHRFFLT